MGIVRELVGQEINTMGFSMEEIDAEVEALDIEDEAAVEVAVDEPADEIEAEYEAASDEIEAEAEDIEEAESVVQDLDVAATAMEAYIGRGVVSQEEFGSIVGFATGSMARLGLESRAFSLEANATDADRIEQLRLAQEDLKETAAKIKEAVKVGAAKFKQLVGPLFEKFGALLGSRVMKAKVALRKLAKSGDAVRETIRIPAVVDRYINDENPVKTLEGVQKAADHFYNELQADLKEWSLHKIDEAPKVKQGLLDKVPFKPELTFNGARVKVSFEKVKGRARDGKIETKAELKKILEQSIKALDTVKQASGRWMRWSTVLTSILVGAAIGGSAVATAGSSLVLGGSAAIVGANLFSRSQNAVLAVRTMYLHFCTVIGAQVTYAERHIAGYAKA